LHLFNGGTLNPDFLRQLAALQMLRDHFLLPLRDRSDKPAPGEVNADRTHLLALWVGPSAAKWDWAVDQMLRRIEQYAICHHSCRRRDREYLKVVASNFDVLGSDNQRNESVRQEHEAQRRSA